MNAPLDPIPPAFDLPEDCEEIELYRGGIELQHASASARGDGRVYLSFSPALAVKFELAEDIDTSLIGTEVRLVLDDGPDIDRALMYRAASSTTDGRTAHVIEGYVHGSVVDGNAAAQSQFVRFMVVNGPPLFGEGCQVLQRDGARWPGSHTFTSGDWRVRLDLLQHPSKRAEALAERRGFGLTHLGHLERIDGDPFSIDNARHVLENLQRLLSFVGGAWCAVVLPAGGDGQGEAQWAIWEMPRCDYYGRAPFAVLRGDSCDLPQLATGLLDRLLDRGVGEAAGRLVAYYLNANRTDDGIEFALMASQAALELFAWITLHEDPAGPTLSTKQLKSKAADTLRRCAGSADLPTAVPAALADLEAWRKSEPCSPTDAAEALTRLRNQVTHPRRRDGHFGPPVEVWKDAWLLSQHWVGLMILHWIGYDGDYVSRIEQRTERVPWVRS